MHDLWLPFLRNELFLGHFWCNLSLTVVTDLIHLEQTLDLSHFGLFIHYVVNSLDFLMVLRSFYVFKVLLSKH